jgi:hypothetical protein
VDIFNFSFLDILACVIGLLIFVLTIVVVSGSGDANAQTVSRLSSAEHQLQTARSEAQMSASRRRRDEQLLVERSLDMADPEHAANVVRAQIQSLKAERAELEGASASANARFSSLATALELLGRSPNVDPGTAEIEAEIHTLDQKVGALQDQVRAEQEKSSVQHVQYYVPHLREVARRTLWVEISGDNLWCVGSADYDRDVLDGDSTRYARRAEARGTVVAQMTKSEDAVPLEISIADPGKTIIEVVLRPSGYAAFRTLRDWAWNKGFSVNWAPLDEDAIILTHATHVFEQ